MLKITLFSLLFFFCINAEANLDFPISTEDSTYTHVRKRAAILSAIVPGSGQIYNEIGYRKIQDKNNRAWWKVPVIYGGLAACGYYFYHNNQYANLTKQEYLFRVDNETSYLDARFINYPTSESLIVGYESIDEVKYNGFDTYANRRDLFMVGFIAVWGLNVIEAYVDAHFVTFDVNEDLSLSWRPTLIGNKNWGIGINLTFN